MERISDKIDILVDRIPELPFFIFAFIYLLTSPKPREIVHVFSICFIFIVIGLGVGMMLKLLFKIPRPKRHYSIKAIDYGFPSLHSLISAGALTLVWYVEPTGVILLLPITLFYMISRHHLGVHRWSSILAGSILGIIIAILCITYLYEIYFNVKLEIFFTILFFLLPPLITLLRNHYVLK